MTVITIMAGAFGYLKPMFFADSAGYLEASRMPLHEVLINTRTLGYPLLLQLVSGVSPEFGLLPWVHLGLLFTATFFLDTSLRHFGAFPWAACMVSSGAMYGAIQQFWWIAAVLTDLTAVVMAITAVACLFRLSPNPRQPMVWVGLTASLALSYHVRPMYLFMILLAPALGVTFRFLHSRRTSAPFLWRGYCLALAGASILPYLGYCALRLLMVGHFALVSFGGFTFAGLAIELLDPPLAETELPAAFQPLAQTILSERERLEMKSAFGDSGRINMRRYEDNYCRNVYEIAIPAARKFYGDNPVIQNRELSSFSQAVISQRTGKYLLWVAYSVPRAVAKVLFRSWFIQISLALGIFIAVLRCWRRKSLMSDLRKMNGDFRTVLLAVSALAFLFFVAVVGAVIGSGVAGDSRNVVPAGLFVPSVLLLLLQFQWELRSKGS